MEPEERDFLRWIGAPDDHRLACRMRVHGDVVVDYTDLKVQP
jgi:ferredoxin